MKRDCFCGKNKSERERDQFSYKCIKPGSRGSKVQINLIGPSES